MKIKNRRLRRAVYSASALALAVATLIPSLSAKVSAAQVTSRSIQMSSSTAGNTGTSYDVKFTTATTGVIQGVVVDFCDETPLIGDATCTKPTGFSVGTPTVTGVTGLTAGTWTAGQLNTNRTLTLTNSSGASVNSGTAVEFTLTTATNPSTANHTFYARILTYATPGGATGYVAGTEGSYIDYGGVALATGTPIVITARVMESIAFCVYKTSCGDDPSFTIGNANNVLDTSAVYTKTVNFSLATNAQSGADIFLKGGTLTSGSNTIAAKGATAGAITAGTAAFGLYLSTLGTNVTATSPYSSTASNYALDTPNTTSTYGQQIAGMSGPTNTSVTTLTYGATASNTSAAGIYTATHQLIATGRF
ncbi:MAG TPA: hypothetical protein VJ843_03635 [Candidatus Saccharimonadales bacterium]|nr:hypothetical protein [Candidatus Saccharimonadales bacterium]